MPCRGGKRCPRGSNFNLFLSGGLPLFHDSRLVGANPRQRNVLLGWLWLTGESFVQARLGCASQTVVNTWFRQPDPSLSCPYAPPPRLFCGC